MSLSPPSRAPSIRGYALLACILFANACAAPPRVLPDAYQQPHVVYFVANASGDDTAMEQEIAAELRRRGFVASGGAYENRPAEMDVLVLYRDSWWINILAKGEVLVLEMRDARTGSTLATAEQRWISHVADAPDTLVADAVTSLLGRAPPAAAPPADQN